MLRQQAQRAQRLDRHAIPLADPGAVPAAAGEGRIVECGWGRLIAGHTFPDAAAVAAALLAEGSGKRDIAFYLDKPHVVVAQAPQDLFVDPSETYRLWLANYRPPRAARRGFTVRRLRTRADIAAANAIYRDRRMVTLDPAIAWEQRTQRHVEHVLAEDRATGEVIGVAMGIDHCEAWGDPAGGSSLWSLAVAPQAAHPGVGEAITRHLAEHFQARGRNYMDLSVLHDNRSAIALYEKLGFRNVAVFAVKRRNAINVPLFTTPAADSWHGFNPYARIILDEALRRGIGIDPVDPEAGYFKLSHAGRTVACRESLSELTSAVAMSRCADKRVTSRLLAAAGLNVPAQAPATTPEANRAFLRQHGSIVVKPVDGEQGKGISVGITDADEMEAAIETASRVDERVLLEQFCEGQDLRIVVIGHQVVAAAVRRPATVVGDGQSTIADLIAKQSRRRAAATGGESKIPLDAETRRCIGLQGWQLEDVLPADVALPVRRTANLHTGGTIHDVTAQLHPTLRMAAEQASRVLEIPVTGLDFLVPAVDGPDYVIIEANERPGLANHEPQPTAQRFVDLLFPTTRMQEVAA